MVYDDGFDLLALSGFDLQLSLVWLSAVYLLRFLTSAVVMSRKNDAKELSLNLEGRVRWI